MTGTNPRMAPALVAPDRDTQLTGHPHRALDNGLTRGELAEAVTLPRSLGFESWPGSPRTAPTPRPRRAPAPLRSTPCST